MREQYFDHDADIGIIGRGNTLMDCFADGARVMFSMMTDLSVVKPNTTCQITFEESDIELAFVTWLNRLLAESNANNLVFSLFTITQTGNHWRGEAHGETWRDDMERGTDVKGATLTMLSVKKIDDEWEARCVVDV